MPRNERLKAARTSVQRYAYSQAAATILLANPIPVHSDEKGAWKGTSHENLGSSGCLALWVGVWGFAFQVGFRLEEGLLTDRNIPTYWGTVGVVMWVRQLKFH